MKKLKIFGTLLLSTLMFFCGFSPQVYAKVSAQEFRSTTDIDGNTCVIIDFVSDEAPTDLNITITEATSEEVKTYQKKVSKKLSTGKLYCLYKITYTSNGKEYEPTISSNIKIYLPSKIAKKKLSFVSFNDLGTIRISSSPVLDGNYYSAFSGDSYVGVVYDNSGTTITIFISALVITLAVAVTIKIIKLRHADPEYIERQKKLKRPKKRLK